MFKSRAGKSPNSKESSIPSRVSAVASDLSVVSLTKDAPEEEAEAAELENSPLEVRSEACVGGLGAVVLNSAATFCCGGQEAEKKATTTEPTEPSDVDGHATGTADGGGASSRS